MTSEFLGYTVGLECWVEGRLNLVKVEFSREGHGVRLRAVSGHNLSRIPAVPARFIREAEYEDRPEDPYDSTIKAIWALGLLGLTPAALDTENDDD